MRIVQFMALAMLLGSIPFRDLAINLAINLAIRSGKRATEGQPVLGIPAMIVVYLLEAARGFLPVYVAKVCLGSVVLALLIGVIAVVSSSFPYWLMFKRRGEGLITCLGVIIALNPIAALCAIAIWLVIAAAIKPHPPTPSS